MTPAHTLRQEMIALLKTGWQDVRGLSQALGIREKEVHGHLAHVSRSIRRGQGHLICDPFECLGCGYRFKDRERFTRPGRCPRCRKTWIQNAAWRIVNQPGKK